jgi:hypothetical protein
MSKHTATCPSRSAGTISSNCQIVSSHHKGCSHIVSQLGGVPRRPPIPKPAYRSLIRYLIRCFRRLQLSAWIVRYSVSARRFCISPEPGFGGSLERGTVLKRREFVIQGAAAVATPIIARAALFPLKKKPKPAAAARVIWSAVSEAVQSERAAAGSISSSEGTVQGVEADLHSVFAKEISLSVVPSYAILQIFAFTRYRLYVNGNYIGRGPSRYQNQRPELDSRDIRRALQP